MPMKEKRIQVATKEIETGIIDYFIGITKHKNISFDDIEGSVDIILNKTIEEIKKECKKLLTNK